jgi:hypothetical protein
MDNKELSDEEMDAIKKFIIVKSVLDGLEHQKKCTNSDSNNMQNKARVGKLASDMGHAFMWGSTEEGHNYWSDVYNRLRRIAQEGF